MVRSATIEDIPSINKLGKLLNTKFEILFKMKDILNEEFSKVYVYESSNKIVGFLHITELYETVDIINIVVDEEYRHQNIASIMIDYMMGDISQTVELITLEVAVDNEKAIKLYKKFNFEVINERKAYYGNKNAYLMGKKTK